MSSAPSFKFIVILASIGSLGPFAIDTYLPALPGMVSALDATPGMVQWTIAAYLIGLALFPLFIAPLSDALGRKPVLYWALSVFVVITALCALAPTVEILIVLRLFQAAAGGTVMTVARAVLADLYRGDALSRAVSYLMLVFTTAPIIAPLIGGLILEVGGWRWIFGFLAFIALVIMAAMLSLPETVPAEARRKFSMNEALSGYLGIAKSRMARGYLFLTFASSLFFFALLSGAPFIFIDYFGVSPSWLQLLFRRHLRRCAARKCVKHAVGDAPRLPPDVARYDVRRFPVGRRHDRRRCDRRRRRMGRVWRYGLVDGGLSRHGGQLDGGPYGSVRPAGGRRVSRSGIVSFHRRGDR